MDPIRECPHCTHDRCVLLELEDQGGKAYAVHCPECGARGPVDPMPEFAVYKWNRRGELPIPDPEQATQH